ncbi:hypothetical protein GCM10010294_46120 [Streptomyces griseoloalbus]|nr:hypothetical protein GCM10010294_46120 [Streptomyces griseoloalbus]
MDMDTMRPLEAEEPHGRGALPAARPARPSLRRSAARPHRTDPGRGSGRGARGRARTGPAAPGREPSNVLLTLAGPLQVPRRQREFRRRGPSCGTAHHRPRLLPRHTDTFGAVCDDVLTLKRATEKQLVTTSVAARSNRDVCNQAPHTVTLTPVGDDLVYGSDSKDSGRPKARLSKIE